MNTPDKKYTMQISLNVLNHLGINLYSNIPSVLAEVVANSWDADANEVKINYDNASGILTITDNGCGMTFDELNQRYLKVGYQRRESAQETHGGRKPMGRKGIGKLSLFSIANKIHVQSKRDGQENAFLMDADAIQGHIKSNPSEPYHPKDVDNKSELLPNSYVSGTAIQITKFKKRFTKLSIDGLRKRLARRFSVIGKDGFAMFINGKEVKYSDRDYFHKARFLFQYGKDEFSVYCTKLDTDDSGKPMVYQRCYQFDENEQAVDNSKHEIKGWIAYAHHSHDLDGGNGEDNLNNIAITVRGKVAQEDILHQFRMGSHASKFIYGEIQADFLDEDSEDDIATSSRQGIVEDEPRYQALKKFIDLELRQIRTITDKSKAKKGVEKALKFHPKIKEWYSELNDSLKKKADTLFGTIERIETDEKHKATLYANGIIAFEKLKMDDALEQLNEVDPNHLHALLNAFKSIEDIEAAHYYEIVNSRIIRIHELRKLTDANEKEKVIQNYIFENLWLLDPAWERATEAAYREKPIQAMIESMQAKDSREIKNGRIDIQYKIVLGAHVIVELKRFSIPMNHGELLDQIERYMNAVKQKLMCEGENTALVEGICIVGKVRGWNDVTRKQKGIESLKSLGIKVLTYDELIQNAFSAYKGYFERKEKVGKLRQLIQAIRVMPDSH